MVFFKLKYKIYYKTKSESGSFYTCENEGIQTFLFTCYYLGKVKMIAVLSSTFRRF